MKFRTYILTALVTLLCSCHSTKQPAAVHDYTPGQTMTRQALAAAYSEVARSYTPQWERVEMPLSLKANGLPMTLSGTALLVRGESVAMSFRMLGMEVAAARISRDSIVFVDRYNSRHLLMSTEELTRRFPVTLDNIQDLLTGRAFIIGTPELPASPAKGVELVADPDSAAAPQWYLMPPSPDRIPADYAFVFDAANRLTDLAVKIAGGAVLNVKYTDSTTRTPYGEFAREVRIDYARNEQTALANYARLKWSVEKARWNADARNINVTVPRDSRRVDAATFLKAMGGASR